MVESSVRSKRKVVRRASAWRVHRFEVWSGGGLVASVEVLRMKDSLLLWLGTGTAPALSELALGLLCVEPKDTNGGAAAAGRVRAVTTDLVGGADSHSRSSELASRLAVALNKVVFVSCNLQLDRLVWPIVEKGLMLEIKNKPDCF